jgi:hypothetical protein
MTSISIVILFLNASASSSGIFVDEFYEQFFVFYAVCRLPLM